jgi:formate dehydrogenase major subunit
VSIASLKYFVSDRFLEAADVAAEILNDTGKTVGIVGGGPGGLTAAYFLRRFGHDVTVYDAMPQMGGMLRYGIPEYRLPKNVLDKEISLIERMGVSFVNGVKIGKDVDFEDLRRRFDAVVVAAGAWSSMKLRCPGEDFKGVFGGIDFLRMAALGGAPDIGKRTAVVGGGNTAMDACRTAVRLGADEVYVVYRRTRDEMPAEDVEIEEAMEEGVIFKFLTNPIEIIAEDGRVSKIRLQKMRLGEPDASGRRSPVAIPGEEEIIDIDSVIVAIGQTPQTGGLDGLALTKWGTVAADERTFLTNLEGVFAVGDVSNKGADIAVAAVGEARDAAFVIDGFLRGDGVVGVSQPYLVKSEPVAEDFSDREKVPRVKMRHLSPGERKVNFKEINYGFSEDEAACEAARCLECGCMDYFECKLINIVNDYDVKPEKYAGEKFRRKVNNEHPYLSRNPDKCILCGLCVRVCDEVMGVAALGLMGRGFESVVQPAFDADLAQSGCTSCGQCAALCPTGALTERITAFKGVPVEEDCVNSVCTFCSAGCRVKLTYKGSMLLRCLPDVEADKLQILCEKGRFGCIELLKLTRVTGALVKGVEADLGAACECVNKEIRGVISEFGKEAVAVAVSGGLTNEDLTVAKRYADALGIKIYSFGRKKAQIAAEKPRKGSVRLDDGANSRCAGEVNIGYAEVLIDIINNKAVKGLIVLQDDVDGLELSGLEFLCIASAYITETVERADVVLPLAGFGESEGTYTGCAGEILTLNRAFEPLCGYTNVDVIESLLRTV